MAHVNSAMAGRGKRLACVTGVMCSGALLCFAFVHYSWISESYYLYKIQNSGPEAAREACAALARVGSVRALESVSRACIEQKDDIRTSECGIAAGNICTREPLAALPALRQMLQSEDARRRWCGAYLLRFIGKDAVPDLRHALSDKSPMVIRSSMLSLGHMGRAAQDAVADVVAAIKADKGMSQVFLPGVAALGDIGVGTEEAMSFLKRWRRPRQVDTFGKEAHRVFVLLGGVAE